MRGSWRPNRTAIYWPPLLRPSALCLCCSPGLLNRSPGGAVRWVLAFSTTSCHQRVWSPNSLTSCPHRAQSRLASPSSESQPSSSEAETQQTAFSQISPHVSGAWRHLNTLVPIPIWDFYLDISEWQILSASAWTPALMFHLTNPCAKRKVLILTKLKGKIYKTKSLRHYITWLVNNRCIISCRKQLIIVVVNDRWYKTYLHNCYVGRNEEAQWRNDETVIHS